MHRSMARAWSLHELFSRLATRAELTVLALRRPDQDGPAADGFELLEVALRRPGARPRLGAARRGARAARAGRGAAAGGAVRARAARGCWPSARSTSRT